MSASAGSTEGCQHPCASTRVGSPGASRSARRPGSRCAPAHVLREWIGRTYQVEVVEGGYRLDGMTWPSLSAVAKHITGTARSGPRFFGLKGRGGAR